MAVGSGVGAIASLGMNTWVGCGLATAASVGGMTGLAEVTTAAGKLVGVDGANVWIKLQDSKGMAQTANIRMRLMRLL